MSHKAFDINGIGVVTVYKRKGSRHLRLTVNAEGGVRITIPTWVPYRAGVAFAMSRSGWIMTQLPRKGAGTVLRNGQMIGKAHRLCFRMDPKRPGIRTRVLRAEIAITYGPRYTPEDAAVQATTRGACLRALRKQAEQMLGSRLAQLAEQCGASYRSLRIKCMKSRWGSCDQHTNIVLNLYLIQLPWEYIDYVILHELAHTRVMRHGPDFWHELERILPGAREMRRAIRAYYPTLLTDMPESPTGGQADNDE